MMRVNIKRILSLLLILLLFISIDGVYAETDLYEAKEPMSCLEKSDPNEITNQFKSTVEWKKHLQKSNLELNRDHSSHEEIQTILKEYGVSGLNKYQYYTLLKEEKLGEFADNNLLVSFNDGEKSFKNQQLNDLVLKKEWTAELFYTITLKKSLAKEEFMNLLEMVIEDPNVAIAQPDFTFEYAGKYFENLDYSLSTMTAALDQINVPTAWRYATGEWVNVGMFDTGVNEMGQNVDNSAINDDCPYTPAGHGTPVSIIISGNEEYMGVAPDSLVFCQGGCPYCQKIDLGYNLTDDEKYKHRTEHVPLTSHFASSISILLQCCDIINISAWLDSENINVFYNILTDYPDVLFVQAAGNDDMNLNTKTSTYTYYNKPNFIFVASVDRYDNLSSFSNYGSNVVHIAAPGDGLNIPGADGNVYNWFGTSFAAPFVSGAAALLLSQNDLLTAAQIKDIILNTADVIPDLQGKVQGARRLNVGAAVLSLNPDYSDRYAYLDTNKVLRGKHGANSAWTQFGANLSNAQMNVEDIYIMSPVGNVGRVDADTYGDFARIEGFTNFKTFSAYGDYVVTLDNSNVMRIHRFNNETNVFSLVYSVDNVKTFSLSGNLLYYCFNSSPHLLFYHPNIAKWNSYSPESKTLDGASINAIYSMGSRVHLICADNKYRAYEFHGINNFKELATEENISSFVLSLSENRLITASGSNLNVYGWDSSGEFEPIDTITEPNGANITACKAIDNRICFLAGGNLYGVDGYYSGKTVSLLATNVQSFTCVDRMIGIIQTNGNWWTKNGALTAPWVLQASSGVSKYVMSP